MRRQESAAPIPQQNRPPMTRRNLSPRLSRLTAMTAAVGVLLSLSGFVLARTFEERASTQAVSRQAEQEVHNIQAEIDGLVRNLELVGRSAAASNAPTAVIAGEDGTAQDLLPPGVTSIIWYSMPEAEEISVGKESGSDTVVPTATGAALSDLASVLSKALSSGRRAAMLERTGTLQDENQPSLLVAIPIAAPSAGAERPMAGMVAARLQLDEVIGYLH